MFRRKRTSKVRRSNRVTQARSVKVLSDIREEVSNTQTSSEPAVRDVFPRFRNIGSSVYTVMQSAAVTTIAGSTSAETDGDYAVNLSTISNASAFIAIFDAWRIMQVTFRFIPFPSSPAASGTQAPIYTAIDYDDSATTTIASLQQYDTLKVAPAGSFFQRCLIPRMALAAYAGAFTNFAQGSPGQWLDAASPGVLHYGLKVGIPLSSNPPAWTILADIVFQFRNVH